MSTEQLLAHTRLIAFYATQGRIKEHKQMFPESKYRQNALTGKKASANGRKGRVASGYAMPTLKKKRRLA